MNFGPAGRREIEYKVSVAQSLRSTAPHRTSRKDKLSYQTCKQSISVKNGNTSNLFSRLWNTMFVCIWKTTLLGQAEIIRSMSLCVTQEILLLKIIQ